VCTRFVTYKVTVRLVKLGVWPLMAEFGGGGRGRGGPNDVGAEFGEGRGKDEPNGCEEFGGRGG